MHVSRASHVHIRQLRQCVPRIRLDGQDVAQHQNGREQRVCEEQRGKDVHALLDVPIMIPERADGPRESKGTKDTAEIESNGCQSGIGIRAWVNEGCWQAGKTEKSTQTLKVFCQKPVKAESDW